MGRPREFEESIVLEAATQRFWTYGYEATSVRDLAEAMGITGASLYNAFGDKRALYRKALDYYFEHSFGDRARRFRQLPPRRAIGAFFEEIIERSLSDPKRKGCLLVNTALEVAPHDSEFEQVVANVLVQIEIFFRECIERGQRDGTISQTQPAEDLARLIVGAHLAIRVLARCRPERALMEGLVRPILTLLDSR